MVAELQGLLLVVGIILGVALLLTVMTWLEPGAEHDAALLAKSTPPVPTTSSAGPRTTPVVVAAPPVPSPVVRAVDAA